MKVEVNDHGSESESEHGTLGNVTTSEPICICTRESWESDASDLENDIKSDIRPMDWHDSSAEIEDSENNLDYDSSSNGDESSCDWNDFNYESVYSEQDTN